MTNPVKKLYERIRAWYLSPKRETAAAAADPWIIAGRPDRERLLRDLSERKTRENRCSSSSPIGGR